MAKEWKKFIVRLDPRVHHTLLELSPHPTRAVRHLVNLYAKKLVEDKYKISGQPVPAELDINLEELQNDND